MSCNCKDKSCGCRSVITKQGVPGVQGVVGPPGRTGDASTIAGPQGNPGNDGAQGDPGNDGVVIDMEWISYSIPNTFDTSGSTVTINGTPTFTLKYAISGKTVFINFFGSVNITNTAGQGLVISDLDLAAILPTDSEFLYTAPASLVRSAGGDGTIGFLNASPGGKVLNLNIKGIQQVNSGDAQLIHSQIFLSLE